MSATLQVHRNKIPNIISCNVKNCCMGGKWIISLPWKMTSLLNLPQPTIISWQYVAVIQKKGTSSATSIENSHNTLPKDITISSPSHSTIQTLSTLSRKSPTTYFPWTLFGNVQILRGYQGQKDFYLWWNVDTARKFPSYHTCMLNHVLKIPHCLVPCKSMSSFHIFLFMNLSN